MSLSSLPLSYCTNVHPGQSVDEILHGLRDVTLPTRKGLNRKIAAGLWIPAAAVEEIEHNSARLDPIRTALKQGDVVCYTLNTFPYGNFHSDRVKEQVYLPDWAAVERLNYTTSCARILSELMPDGTEGSLSTAPLGFKSLPHSEIFEQACIAQLLKLAQRLDEIHDETGKVLRLAIEPEPLCVLETTAETIEFFKKLFDQASTQGELEIAQRHLGVCYDVCHQSVEFEDVEESIARLAGAGIRINKVHITCAIQLSNPGQRPDARRQLATFAEPRYLHQTFARRDGQVSSILDLTPEFCEAPSTEFESAEMWRIHFHVPVNSERIGQLETTRSDLKLALKAVAKIDYAPHLEVETYTWSVLPGEEKPNLVIGLQKELAATYELLDEIASTTKS